MQSIKQSVPQCQKQPSLRQWIILFCSLLLLIISSGCTTNFTLLPTDAQQFTEPSEKLLNNSAASSIRETILFEGNLKPTEIFYTMINGAFSPDCRSLAYPTIDFDAEHLTFVTANGVLEYPEYQVLQLDLRKHTHSRISNDGKYFAFKIEGMDKETMYVVVDGRQEGPYDAIIPGSLMMSADSQHVYYAATQGTKQYIVIDGKLSDPYDELLLAARVHINLNADTHRYVPIATSPQGGHMAYAARNDEQQFVVVDGVMGKRYDTIEENSLRFSNDGKTLAYVASRNDRYFVVINGEEQQAHDFIYGDSLEISSDGRKTAYIIRSRDKDNVILNGKPVLTSVRIPQAWSGASMFAPYLKYRQRMRFSPTGRYLTFMLDESADKPFVVIDEDGVITRYDKSIITFTPDDAHYATATWEDDQTVIRKNGTFVNAVSSPVSILEISVDGEQILYDKRLSKTEFEVLLDGKPFSQVDSSRKAFFAGDSNTAVSISTDSDTLTDRMTSGDQEFTFLYRFICGPVADDLGNLYAIGISGMNQKEMSSVYITDIAEQEAIPVRLLLWELSLE